MTPSGYVLLASGYYHRPDDGTGPYARLSSGSYALLSQGPNGSLPTYRCSLNNLTLAATATDVVQLRASPSKLVRLRQLRVTGSAQSSVVPSAFGIKRTTQNTGGTFVPSAPTVYDSRDAVATAVFGYYTANPSALGASVGLCRSDHLGLSTISGSAADLLPVVWDFGVLGEKPMILLPGSAESFVFNFGGQAVPNGTLLNVGMLWSEEEP